MGSARGWADCYGARGLDPSRVKQSDVNWARWKALVMAHLMVQAWVSERVVRTVMVMAHSKVLA